MEGRFIAVQAPRFAFVQAEDEDGNFYVSAAALAALPRIPHRGDAVRFQIATTRDGRRRAIDLTLKG